MRSTFQILIFCLYALSAVNATLFSKRGGAEVQQRNSKAAKFLNLWCDFMSNDDDDKAAKFLNLWCDFMSDDDDKDDKWSKNDDDKDDKWSKNDDDKDDKWRKDDCASLSVSVLIGTSTYAIPCLQGDSIVNLNGLIPTPSSIACSSATEASSSAVSSSAVDSSSSAASSSETSSAIDSTTATGSTTTTTESTTTTGSTTTTTESTTTTGSTTTTTESTTTTTDTTTSADSSPTTTVTLYDAANCMGGVITTSSGYGCFNCDIQASLFSAGTTSTTELQANFYNNASCVGDLIVETHLTSDTCPNFLLTLFETVLSYSITAV
ncbi:unnamed protein product [Umbelopsis ramanniana]